MLIMNSAWSAETLEFNIRWDTEAENYRVFMRPNTAPLPDISITAQVTIKVPHASGSDRFTVSGLSSSVTGTFWMQNSRADQPDEDPTADYISFTLTAMNTAAFNWQAGEEQEAFSFTNTGKCLGPIELISINDPFNQVPNSRGTRPGNQFTNIGWGGVEGNNYLGIYGASADCNKAPVINTNPGVSVSENTNSIVIDISSIDDNDSEGSGLIYSLSGNGPDDSSFTIDSITGALGFITPPDFEMPTDNNNDNIYTTEVRVCDSSSLCTIQIFNITVSNVSENSAPTITSGTTIILSENISGAVVDIDAIDDNDSEGDGLIYSIISSSGDSELFAVDPSSGELSFIVPPDFELPKDNDINNIYVVGIRLCDSGSLCVLHTINITVIDVNENTAPVFIPVNTSTYPENGSNTVLDIEVNDDNSSEVEGTIAYSLIGSDDDDLFGIDEKSGEIIFNSSPDYENPLDNDSDNIYQLTVRACDESNSCTDRAITIGVSNNAVITLKLRAYLQGAYDGSLGMMDDLLRTSDLLPVSQPYSNAPFNYSGSETLSAAVAADAINVGDNVVDWILADLRSVDDPSIIVVSKALILQRDGDVADAATGSTNIIFNNIAEGNYIIGLRHRNHLGLLSLAPILLTDSETIVDFTLPATLSMGGATGAPARLETGGISMMWAGNANQSKDIVAFGVNNDSSVVLGKVLSAPDNGSELNSNFVLHGYHNTDLNMDGITLFAGRGNDLNILIGNIMLHPKNESLSANFILTGGMWSLENL